MTAVTNTEERTVRDACLEMLRIDLDRLAQAGGPSGPRYVKPTEIVGKRPSGVKHSTQP